MIKITIILISSFFWEHPRARRWELHQLFFMFFHVLVGERSHITRFGSTKQAAYRIFLQDLDCE